MKKFLTTILAFLYLSSSMGTTVHLHYCMGRLVSWGLVNHESGNCDYCGMVKNVPVKAGLSSNRHCCQDEHKIIGSGQDLKVSQTPLSFIKSLPDMADIYFRSLPSDGIQSILLRLPDSNAPPRNAKQPVFLLNCNFRI